VADLSRDIEVKERLVKQLQESVKRYELMKRFYEQKIQQMDEETNRFEADRQRLLRELEDVEKRSEGEQKGRQQALMRQLQEKEAQLKAARRKQEELGQLARVKARTDAHMKQLGEEIGMMKRQKADLLKRLDADKKRFQVALREKSVEIEAMRRAALKDAQEIQRLNTAIEKNLSLMRKKDEEVQRIRLHHQSSSIGSGSGTPRPTPRSRNRSGSGGQRFSSTEKLKYTEEERRTQKWLDHKLREVQKKEEAVERLAEEYNRRLQLLKEKEGLEVAKLKLSSGRRSLREVILGQGFGEEQPGPPREPGATLSEEEAATLEEVEERIQAVQAQLDFKDEKIRKMETIIASRPEGHDTLSQIESRVSTVEQSFMVIRALFDMTVASRMAGKRHAQELREAEEEADRLAALVEEKQAQVEAAKRSYANDLLRQRTDHEATISNLIDATWDAKLLGAPEGEGQVDSAPPVPLEGAEKEQEQMDQLKVLLRLANERNRVLKEQYHQIQTAWGDVQQRTEEWESRLGKAAEDIRDRDDKIKVSECSMIC
jgi:DNA repair exonuclease SbcCD ATPase subunit